MAENAKDTKKQAALREQIEHHPIWNYPPEERLQHNREWQQLYLLVFQFKEFLSKIENRLENTDTNAMLQDEDALLDARYTRRSKLRTKLDTLTFTESMCKAVSKYDVNSGKPFLAYFDAIYANAMHDSVNSKAMRDQGDMRLSRREGQLWKRLCELCEKQGLDSKNLPAGFYETAADCLDVDEAALKRLVLNATTARRTISLNDDTHKDDDGEAIMFDADDPNATSMQERLESATEALRVIVMFASKDVTEFPRIFFTNDVIALLCDEKPAIPPERYCTVLEKKENLLWARIFARDYMNFLFEPHKPDRLRPLLDIKPTHQPKDRTISTFTGKTTVTISNRRKEYKKLLQKMQEQLRQS